MQRLNTLWQAVNTITELKAMTRHRQTYYFSTLEPATFYLRAEHAEVQIMRWALPKIEVTVMLHAAFGWRIATDQDEAGVYVVARRRPVIGNLSSALFSVIVPHDAFLVLNVTGGRIVMEHVTGTVEIPPLHPESSIKLLPSGQ